MTSPILDFRAHTKVVDSLLHPLAPVIGSLLGRSGRQELGYILIDDEENILAALSAGLRLEAVFHSDEEDFSEELERALAPQTTRFGLAKRTGKKIFGNERSSRVFAIARTPAALGLEVFADIAQDIVVLDDVSLMGNVGAITRTALALGLGGLVLLGAEPVDIYDRRLIRASRGGVFALPVVSVAETELLAFVARHDIELAVTSPQARTPAHEIARLPKRLALAFGHEKEGCSPALTDAATQHITIPMKRRVDSLNVSVAAGIILYNRQAFNGGVSTHEGA